MDRIVLGKTLLGLSLAASAIFFVSSVQAEEYLAGTRYDEAVEKEIANIIKTKSFIGGRDEEDLKVQAEIPKAVRKIGPTTEISVAPTGSDGF
jgi:hypothetical protein